MSLINPDNLKFQLGNDRDVKKVKIGHDHQARPFKLFILYDKDAAFHST